VCGVDRDNAVPSFRKYQSDITCAGADVDYAGKYARIDCVDRTTPPEKVETARHDAVERVVSMCDSIEHHRNAMVMFAIFGMCAVRCEDNGSALPFLSDEW
jgi:hypothetical protein